MSNHISNTTLELQNDADKAAIADYLKLRAAYTAEFETALAALNATEDDESEIWAAQTLKETLVTLAEITARYHRAVHRQARRAEEAVEAAKEKSR